MIILKGRVPHTTHSYTKHSHTHKKKRVEKERQQKKAKYPSIKQRNAILALSCLIIYILFHPLKKHKANRRFWGSKYRKIFPLQGLQGKQRLWRHRWVIAILLYSGGSRPSDKAGGGGTLSSRPWHKGVGPVSKKNFSALRPWPQFGLKIRGGLGLPSSSPRSATVIYRVGHWP